MWVGWSARELSEFKKVAAEYDKSNAAVTVKVVGGINDDKIIAALRGGNAPDVVSSFTSANVGIYCPSGGWIDLGPYLKRDKVDMNQFPAATLYYTQYKGKRCALPLLADVYGFYYNKALFAAAGLKAPPKTLAELTTYAKKLTKKNADGSLKVVGYNPFFGFYQNTAGAYQPSVNGKWFDNDGKSSLGKDPAWQKLLRWQKSLVDYYGHKNLVKWNAGAGDEFSASHAFETGKLAMMMDGEWRVAFVAAEHPELKYGTAPMPDGCLGLEPLRLGLHQRHDHRHPEERQEPRRGLEVRQVHDDERPCARAVLERDPQRPLDPLVGDVEGAEAGRELRDVHEDLREPEVADGADHDRGLGLPRHVRELPGEVAGWQGEQPPEGLAGGRQADRRQAEAVGRRHSVTQRR